MFFQQSNYGDIDKYFRNTFIKLKEFGDELFYVGGVSPSCVTGKDQSGEDFELILSDSLPYEVDYVLPSRAIFQSGNRVSMLSRIPARQYKRGLCADNTQLVDVFNGEALPINMESLTGFVNKPRYTTFEEILKGKTPKSVALNSRFSFHSADLSIRCDLRPVGLIDRPNRKIKVNSLFLPEIKSLVSLCKEPIKVEQYE